jgi:hypothetical protein
MNAWLHTLISLYKNESLTIKNAHLLSSRSIKMLLWIRVVVKLYLFLLGLFLMVKFAELMKYILMK